MDDSENRNEGWDKQVLEKLVFTSLQEQRRTRQRGIFFKSLVFVYLFMLLFFGLGWIGNSGVSLSGKHTALVEVRGVISPDSLSSADNIAAGLQSAFKDAKTQGVILRINSPGGSPVQAGHINDEIRRLRGQYPEIPLYVVVEDICASGGSACSSGADAGSHVMKALNKNDQHVTVRFSFSKYNTKEEVDKVVAKLRELL